MAAWGHDTSEILATGGSLHVAVHTAALARARPGFGVVVLGTDTTGKYSCSLKSVVLLRGHPFIMFKNFLGF